MRSLILALAVLAVGCDKKTPEPPPAPAKAPEKASVPAAGKQVAIAVGEDGFAPNEVKIAKGEETSLVFTRTSDKTCAKDVEFPELKVKKELPLNQPVAVMVPSGEARTITFQCGMGMYKSKVVIQ